MENSRRCNTCQQVKPFSDFNKDKSRKHGISYRCKQCHAKVNEKYYDKSKMAAYANDYYWRNRDEINRKARLKRATHPEQSRQYRRSYYQRNKTRINLLSNAWRKANKEVGYRSKSRRRARLKKAQQSFYTTQQVLLTYGTDCYLCGKPIDLQAPRWTAIKGWETGLHIDHVIPIRDGGSDTLENVRPTHGQCNLKKH